MLSGHTAGQLSSECEEIESNLDFLEELVRSLEFPSVYDLELVREREQECV